MYTQSIEQMPMVSKTEEGSTSTNHPEKNQTMTPKNN